MRTKRKINSLNYAYYSTKRKDLSSIMAQAKKFYFRVRHGKKMRVRPSIRYTRADGSIFMQFNHKCFTFLIIKKGWNNSTVAVVSAKTGLELKGFKKALAIFIATRFMWGWQ